MNLQFIPRTFVTSTLRLIRLPVDGALRFAGHSAEGARLAVDRADAGVRETAGVMLQDEVLIKDAGLRRSAAEEREHALRLHAEADFREERAEREAKRASEEADARRSQAEKAATQRRERAKQQRDASKSKVAKRTARRKQAAVTEARKREKVVAERSKRDRLEAIERKGEALDEKAIALTTAGEAKRLEKEASRAKANRKKQSSSR
jgi:hypothetical protein